MSMTLYTHTDMPGTFGNKGVRMPSGVYHPRSWFRTASQQQISGAGFVIYEPPEPEPVPEPTHNLTPLQPWQFWAMMRLTGQEQTVRDYIASLNDEESENYDPQSWAVASAIIDHSLEYRRDHPLVEDLRQLVGMTESQLDDLWNAGHNL
ncbi:hypothetical protein GCM10007989_07250 [Devosia pacifica]|uniref:Uncharacterized protein n=1 Tax=Devosia pacifica TaxID=1335967 RepID=A0A918RXN2_9HYPH|nr:hypothetical protein [Devosia pacifica]GHA15049.1 hypothetical protein GCM10007989_07250 [Devosia pacifica]